MHNRHLVFRNSSAFYVDSKSINQKREKLTKLKKEIQGVEAVMKENLKCSTGK